MSRRNDSGKAMPFTDAALEDKHSYPPSPSIMVVNGTVLPHALASNSESSSPPHFVEGALPNPALQAQIRRVSGPAGPTAKEDDDRYSLTCSRSLCINPLLLTSHTNIRFFTSDTPVVVSSRHCPARWNASFIPRLINTCRGKHGLPSIERRTCI